MENQQVLYKNKKKTILIYDYKFYKQAILQTII